METGMEMDGMEIARIESKYPNALTADELFELM